MAVHPNQTIIATGQENGGRSPEDKVCFVDIYSLIYSGNLQ